VWRVVRVSGVCGACVWCVSGVWVCDVSDWCVCVWFVCAVCVWCVCVCLCRCILCRNIEMRLTKTQPKPEAPFFIAVRGIAAVSTKR
jgi:hypothetical protein